jgi:hypothetical protein
MLRIAHFLDNWLTDCGEVVDLTHRSRSAQKKLLLGVDTWSEFLAADPEVSGSIPSATRFSEQQCVLERSLLKLMSINEELLERKSSGSGLEN